MKRVDSAVAPKATLTYDQDLHVPHLVHLAAASMFAEFVADFPLNITVSMWRILAGLYQHGPQRQVDLARLAVMEQSTNSRTVSALKKRHLVSRLRSTLSSREVVVDITAKGRLIVESFIPMALKHEADLIRGLSPQEVRILRRCLTQIHQNMESMSAVRLRHTVSNRRKGPVH